jgi:transcription initiation factor TFIIF subunit beta
MELLLPDPPEPAIPLPPSHPYLQTNYPRKYDLRITSEQGSDRVRNLYAFKEKLQGGDDNDEDEDDLDSGLEDEKGKLRAGSSPFGGGGSGKGRRVVSMVGTITNEAALKPQVASSIMRPGGSASHGVGLTPEYREVLRKRRADASKPRVSVKVLDDSDRARANMLMSGVSAHTNKASKASLIANTSVTNAAQRSKQQTERFARMPRNELLDILFELFDQYPYWSIKGLRGKVQQPEVYLREVLTTIADLHKRGPYSGNWSIKPEFVEMRKQQDRANTMATSALAGVSTGNTPGDSGATSTGNGPKGDAKQTEDDDDDDDDEEEDLDMEDAV